MGAATETMNIIRGGSFLIEEHPLDQVFIPEEFAEEERLIGDLARDFVEDSVVPLVKQLEAQPLAPNAEITVFPWTDPPELKERTINRVSRFIHSHARTHGGTQ